jgi:hypothetical protein
MNLSRRQFIAGTILLASTPFVLKIQAPNFLYESNLERFLEKYQSVINLDNFTEFENVNNLDNFKTKIELLLVNTHDQSNWNTVVEEIIKKDYEFGNIRVVNGWIISETELKILILKNKYV